MKLLFLGTGTSSGIPMIGCDCAVCTSTDPRNKRRRASLYVQSDDTNIIVDTPPDFREQVLQYKVPRIDAVLFTHTHADHIFGLDDIRRFNTMQSSIIPAYASSESMLDIKRIFDYIGKDKIPGFYRPLIEFKEVKEPFDIGTVHIEPVLVEHGNKHTVGYIFAADDQKVGYVPDCHGMLDDAVEKLQGLDIMVLDGLRHTPHKTHLTIEESLGLLSRIKAKQSYMTHMCHDINHEETEKALPDNVKLTYDGLEIAL